MTNIYLKYVLFDSKTWKFQTIVPNNECATAIVGFDAVIRWQHFLPSDIQFPHFSHPYHVPNKPRFSVIIFKYPCSGKPPSSDPSAGGVSHSVSLPKSPQGSRTGGQKSYHHRISISPFPSLTKSRLMNRTDLYHLLARAYKSFVDYYI